MDLKKLKADYDKLVMRQMIIAEGIRDLEAIQKELNADVSKGQFWGSLAVVAQAAMIPLNIIINAFEAKQAVTIYQIVVKKLYEEFGAPSSDSPSQAGLDLLKDVLVSHLETKGLTQYVPGVNILVGFAQDSISFYEIVKEVGEGTAEQRNMTMKMNQSIEKAKRELLKLGVDRAQMHEQMSGVTRTA